ncbi:trafficking kinesin-binding protein 1-like isoform X1 [Paramormyrops kingsleyae]|uniref:trafficking kinesin-binding protein 1-like isoform X1 n=1 Tax=Paramormyrops kingsleyae TaxID=1676925 RepID=UPI003B9734CC
MTKTYSDIDAVTRLLEERERDLELAARIGQSLLKKNRNLIQHNEYLEEQVGRIQDEVFQLHHELSMKDELLRFYTSVADDSEGDSSGSTPSRRNRSTSSMPSYFPVDSMQKKLKDLELENIILRSEASHLKTETYSYEEKEHQLVDDCVRELRESSLQISSIAEELARKTEDASRQQEEITHLLSQIVDLQKKAKSYAIENEELTQHLRAAKDAQHQLTGELQELEDKYAECIEMLHEAQEELKNLRNKALPYSTPRRIHPLGFFPMDSLAAEIEGSMRKEMEQDDAETPELNDQHKRVFETVKHINQAPRTPVANIPGSNRSSSPLKSSPSRPRPHGGSVGSTIAVGMPDDSADDSNKHPGTRMATDSQDLELALRRLSLRRENYLSERRFSKEERERSLRGSSEGSSRGGHLTPCDSIMSLGTSLSGLSGYTYCSRSYLPDKLQIVKPLEGSATLHHWQQLAQPNLGGILDSRPGVISKGFRPLDLELEQVYQFADFEEDEPGEVFFQNLPGPTPIPGGSHASSCTTPGSHQTVLEAPVTYYPGKCMSHTNSTYTFTTCRILHPSDELTQVTPSLNAASGSCIMTSTFKATPAATPCTPRRLSLAESFTNLRDSTKTTSTSLGLVRLLQERGISAAVYHPPSWARAGNGALSSAAATLPAPDPPTHTPPTSPTNQSPAVDTDAPFDFQTSGMSYENFLASRPAHFILREVTAEGRKQADRESQTDVSIYNLNLVDKLKRFSVAGPRAPLRTLTRPGPPFSLSADLRRNRSYPAVVGASMAMKGPGPPSPEDVLGAKLPRQSSLQ